MGDDGLPEKKEAQKAFKFRVVEGLHVNSQGLLYMTN